MGETRVNLKHLLEDIRDTYPFAIEEAILTELVANALDSGASEIHLATQDQAFTVRDNGQGMTPSQLDRYHDIAATTKERGKGIGFAGIGAKLALLIAGHVVTETRAGPSYNATRWRLESSQRAPWELLEPRHLIAGPHGTAVTLEWAAGDQPSPLADAGFVQSVVHTHFHPLLEEGFRPVMQEIYPGNVRFFLNDRPLKPPKIQGLGEPLVFVVQGGNPKPVGIGFLGKSRRDLPEPLRGIGISAYGKVIKRGWDWLGLLPQHPHRLTGIVEVPALAQILTTNKADFLRDAASLKKYYRHRKAIQETLEPILRELGEAPPTRERPAPEVRPVQREVEQVLGALLEDYPEFAPLVGRRRARQPGLGLQPEPGAPTLAALTKALQGWTESTPGPDPDGPTATPTQPALAAAAVLEANEDGAVTAALRAGRRVGPGLVLAFEDAAERGALGRMVGNTLWINRAHPAYRKAAGTGCENYHIVLSVVWVLLGHLDDRHSAQQFISEFLSGWGRRASTG
jgi:hypothetical protein